MIQRQVLVIQCILRLGSDWMILRWIGTLILRSPRPGFDCWSVLMMIYMIHRNIPLGSVDRKVQLAILQSTRRQSRLVYEIGSDEHDEQWEYEPD